MINKNNDNNPDHSYSRLPKEIIIQLNKLHGHTTLPQQTVSFSTDLPCGDGRKLRWNRRLKQLPYPHIIQAGNKAENISLLVYHQNSGQVLELAYEGGVWRRVSSQQIEQAEKAVPNRHRHESKRWFHKSATSAQRHLIARILQVKMKKLPPLTAYNANLIITTCYLMEHMKIIHSMIDLWLAELARDHRAPLLPFAELESA